MSVRIYKFSVGLGRIPDIRLIYNAGYLVSGRLMKLAGYPENYRIFGRITGIRNQPGIRCLNSFNILYPTGYLAKSDIRPNTNFQSNVPLTKLNQT